MALVFEDKVREEEVTIGEQKFVLREPSAEAGAKLRAARQAAITRDDDGKFISSDQEKIELADAVIVGECLFPVSPEGVTSETPVGKDFEHLKRDLVVQALFRKLEEWRRESNVKNSPSSTPTKSE